MTRNVFWDSCNISDSRAVRNIFHRRAHSSQSCIPKRENDYYLRNLLAIHLTTLQTNGSWFSHYAYDSRMHITRDDCRIRFRCDYKSYFVLVFSPFYRTLCDCWDCTRDQTLVFLYAVFISGRRHRKLSKYRSSEIVFHRETTHVWVDGEDIFPFPLMSAHIPDSSSRDSKASFSSRMVVSGFLRWKSLYNVP